MYPKSYFFTLSPNYWYKFCANSFNYCIKAQFVEIILAISHKNSQIFLIKTRIF